jgi:hypothetical protein
VDAKYGCNAETPAIQSPLVSGRSSATSSPSFAPHAPFRTTGDEVEPTSLGGENKQRPLLPIVGVRDFDAGMHAACRERRLVSVTNWRNRHFADPQRSAVNYRSAVRSLTVNLLRHAAGQVRNSESRPDTWHSIRGREQRARLAKQHSAQIPPQ